MRQIEKFVSLKVLDSLWVNHLENMDYLRDSVRLRAYGQRDPLVEYKSEGHRMFCNLLSSFESTLANAIFRAQINPTPSFSSKVSGKVTGRNDPCPCGSGKKYKKCCWPKYG